MSLKQHVKTINRHKYYVLKCAIKAGIPWRGVKHDLSKYSLIELKNGAKYYTGTSSPVDAERKAVGRCDSWHHHKGHNDHHWEYWVDFSGGEVIPRAMPNAAIKELICDYIAASIVYAKASVKFNEPFATPLEYFEANQHKFMFHEGTRFVIENILYIAKTVSINEALEYANYTLPN